MDIVIDLDKDGDLCRTLADRKKYNMELQKLIRIANMVSAHHTTDFYKYLDDLEK